MKNSTNYLMVAYGCFLLGIILHYTLPTYSLGTYLVIVTGISTGLILFQFSSFYFMGIGLRQILDFSNDSKPLIVKAYGLYIGIPFSLISLTGVFSVLEWATPLLLYVFSFITCIFSVVTAYKLQRMNKIGIDEQSIIRKSLIILITVILIFGIVIIFNWQEFAVTISPESEPRQRWRY